MNEQLLIELKRTRTMLVLVLLVVGCIHAWNYDHAQRIVDAYDEVVLETLDECIVLLDEEDVI